MRRVKPDQATLVPERREEITTEGGLDVAQHFSKIQQAARRLSSKGIEVSLFIDPEIRQVRMAAKHRAHAVELHTGSYANARGRKKKWELARLRRAAMEGHRLGLKINAGHGLDYRNVRAVARLPHVAELNIGHSILSRSVFVGIRKAVQEMKKLCVTRK
jgi:pyridoxine 5-phosphate synthase